jgi:hypothetical protein
MLKIYSKGYKYNYMDIIASTIFDKFLVKIYRCVFCLQRV